MPKPCSSRLKPIPNVKPPGPNSKPRKWPFLDWRSDMSKMESKKLQTTPMQISVAVSHAQKLGPSHLLPGSLYADLAHDACIAHEQREVLEAIVSNIPEDLLFVNAQLC